MAVAGRTGTRISHVNPIRHRTSVCVQIAPVISCPDSKIRDVGAGRVELLARVLIRMSIKDCAHTRTHTSRQR